MSDHPSTFGGGTTGKTGDNIAWNDRAALHRADDGDGIFDGAKALSRGTFADMIRHVMTLPEADRDTYVIEKAGDREYRAAEIAALAARPDFPAEDTQ
ncbi:hypothetical protein HME9302_01306 [Alteripontixanthobacter maritimus]|uniref:Uncharacterized protein n=1 Tax=Alteripontixanthobacter maritimus TaxID=2161824 RepID=A0A369QA35_9SPHN|nr:hypothetical protein [Alteripontixanthobacter maritimus]RDC60107.1 hypothetical protein HME9302_01306 [Alteripontixanthobacter maritimus]